LAANRQCLSVVIQSPRAAAIRARRKTAFRAREPARGFLTVEEDLVIESGVAAQEY